MVHLLLQVPPHLHEALNKELDLQEKIGIIKPAGPIPWISYMVVVPNTVPGQVQITQD